MLKLNLQEVQTDVWLSLEWTNKYLFLKKLNAFLEDKFYHTNPLTFSEDEVVFFTGVVEYVIMNRLWDFLNGMYHLPVLRGKMNENKKLILSKINQTACALVEGFLNEKDIAAVHQLLRFDTEKKRGMQRCFVIDLLIGYLLAGEKEAASWLSDQEPLRLWIDRSGKELANHQDKKFWIRQKEKKIVSRILSSLSFTKEKRLKAALSWVDLEKDSLTSPFKISDDLKNFESLFIEYVKTKEMIKKEKRHIEGQADWRGRSNPEHADFLKISEEGPEDEGTTVPEDVWRIDRSFSVLFSLHQKSSNERNSLLDSVVDQEKKEQDSRRALKQKKSLFCNKR